MTRVLLALCLFAVLLAPNTAVGGNLLEARLGASITATDPDDLNQQLQNLDLDSSISGFNVDAFLNIPLLPIGAGVRYARATQDQSSSSGESLELAVDDFSLIVDWRLLNNMLFYVGPLLTLGYPWGDVTLDDSGKVSKESIDPDQLSIGLAAEGGLHLSRFLIGAELGYKSTKLESPGILGLVPEINTSGFYGRLLLGIGLF